MLARCAIWAETARIPIGDRRRSCPVLPAALRSDRLPVVVDARRHTDRHERVGVTEAVLRGPGRWMPPEPSSAMRAIAAGCVGALTTVGIVATLEADDNPTLRTGGAWAAAVLLALPIVWRTPGGWSLGGLGLAVRVLGLVVLLGGVMVPFAADWAIGLWPALGAAVGADAALSIRSVRRLPAGGVPLGPMVLSARHLLWLVLVAAAALAFGNGWTDVLAAVVAAEAVALMAMFTAWWALRVMARYDDELRGTRTSALEREHRAHAAFIHDDVVPAVRLLRQQLVRSGVPDADGLGEVVAELERIEHTLRDGQLEATLRSGSATVAEIVQPFLRIAQSHRVALRGVPARDVGSLRLGESAGRLLRRCVAVPVTNAVLAGAQTLTIEIDVDGSHLVVLVEDDAGGFDQQPHHQGRALDQLAAELPDAVTVERLERGTRVVSRVPLTERAGRRASAGPGRPAADDRGVR